jgi:2-aminophenol/2-amino-5-chlorophenol 1,6-dioxygenase subunit beta
MLINAEKLSGKIISGWLAPHPPHLVYAENPAQNEPKSRGGWDTLRHGYRACRESIRERKPDVIIVHSPHWQTVVGHHVLCVPKLKGFSVDPIFPHLFRYHFEMDIDCELARAIHNEGEALGLTMSKMENPQFRVDYGTIVTLHMMNPAWDIPVVGISANNSPYFYDDDVAQEEMLKLGEATRRAVEKTGRRAVVAASNTLSHLHFSKEPNPDLPEDMSKEHIFSQSQYEWDMKIIELLKEGRLQEYFKVLPRYMQETFAEVKSGSLTWMLSAMAMPKIGAKFHAYGAVIGTGNAVLEWDLEQGGHQ